MTSTPVAQAPGLAHGGAPECSPTAQRASPAKGVAARTPTHLFINEGLNSSGRRSHTVAGPQDRAAIYSHVQRFRLHRDAQTRPVPAGALVLYRPARAETLRGSPSCETESREITIKRRAGKLGTNSPHGAVEEGADGDKARVWSNNFLPGDVYDPFNCTAIRIDQANHKVVQFFLNVGWRAHLKIFGHTDSDLWSPSFKDIPEVIRGCLSSEMHFNAFLTLNAIRMKFYGLATFDRSDCPEGYMVKCLRALRNCLSDVPATGVSEFVILDVFFLAFSEFYRQNYDAMRIHLKMIQRLVPLMGGFSGLCQYVREACCFTELSLAIETGQQPLFPLTWDPGPLHSLWWSKLKPALQSSTDKVFGLGFDEALDDGFFDVPVSTIIEDLLVDLQVFEFIRKEANPLPSDIEWACTRSRAYVHRLLSLRRPHKDSSRQDFRIYCVITTLVIVFSYECTYVSALRSGKLVLSRLKKSLRLGVGEMDAMEYRWGRQNHMLLWIMVVGACVADGGMEEKWFWDRAIHGCRLLGIYTPDGLRDLMSRFMGTVDLHAGLLERLAGYIDTVALDGDGRIQPVRPPDH